MFPPHRYYYLHNFQRALAWVADRYADLLDAGERRFLEDFQALPQASQALMVRMLMRRGPWFRASRLVYEEIASTQDAAAPLQALGWLDADAPMTLDEVFALHTKPELCRLFGDASVKPAARKADLLEALRARHDAPQPYAAWNPAADEPVWRVMVGDLCERLRLMFFGNLYQDWSEFVLADLGVFQYEAVPFEASSRAFQTRADVDGYLALHACRAALDEGAELDALLRAVDDCASQNPWLEKRRAKVLLRIGQACERAQDWAAAQRVYTRCAYPGARHRRIRVHERMAQYGEALALALQAQSAPESEEESQRVARMLPRLYRGAGQGAPARAAAPALLRTDLSLPRPAQPMAVEFVTRDHLHQDDAPVHYVENALINSLFGLLCWPAVFAPLPGAFFHPFQRAPADLDAPDFHQRRAALFNDCLGQLDTHAYRDVILQRYAEKSGVQSPFVFWGALSDTLLAQALDCLPAAHLKLYFTRLLRDVKTNRSGFPDLIRFWPAERRYELVEVKGPGDKLQDNQIRWLQYCVSHGMPVRVCHVSWREDAA
ncbi:nuclease [Achromobacter marplatensis]|uniref:phosphodiesterase I n=1 Tax=Achromobacter marplatensis TaxID=470868 RepID=A0ABX9GNP1_9BURK|nr:VRR-NUC domain-containing protein [Achromobacter marplatensis]OWT72022.1 nuclease [Achromobacter marplatensis]RBP24714.1 VRR-NUC domain-containing protein [Achromobacter marplatensis]CAB3624912.1 Fanconi-associated nuclease 1 [Achromobacter marplatensis]